MRANDDGLRINQDVEVKKEENIDGPASPESLGRPRTPPERQFAGQSEMKMSRQSCTSTITNVYLLSLDCRRELGRERDMGNRHVVQNDVEPQRPLHQVLSYEP